MTPKVQCINCAHFQPAEKHGLWVLGVCRKWKTKHYPQRERPCRIYEEKPKDEE